MKINKSIDISNLSYTWFWPQFTHCAVVFAQGKANFRVDKERFFLLKVFFSSLKQVIWLKTFFAAEDKTISLICFSSSKWLGERERTKKKDDVFPNLPSLHGVWFLRYQNIILSAQVLLSLKDLLNKYELEKNIAKRKNVILSKWG